MWVNWECECCKQLFNKNKVTRKKYCKNCGKFIAKMKASFYVKICLLKKKLK